MSNTSKFLEVDCIFCKIVAGLAPADKVYEDSIALAFRSMKPLAPTHIIVIPKAYVDHNVPIEHLFRVIQSLVVEFKLNSYRIVTNIGHDAGQTVPHFHFHLLGGKVLGPIA
jgi:histidine triad (HIT) family protein